MAKMGSVRVLELAGTPYEMGYAHGRAWHDAIHMFTEERIRLSSDPNWTGHTLPRQQVLALAEECLAEHERYAPELVEELRGMADATGLGLAELVIMNGFTDFVDLVYNAGQRITAQGPQATAGVDDCTAFIVPDGTTADGPGYYGQTWDMHDSATPYVILLRGRPQKGPQFLVFTTAGCVGMIGMNAAGIALGINNIMGGDGQVGVTWPFVVRKALAQTDIEAALECITSARLAGAHNYLLFDRNGRGYNIEAMSTHCHVEPLADLPIVHTNHCLMPKTMAVERPRPAESQANSEARLLDAQRLLGQRPITLEMLMALTRDEAAICRRPQPPMHVESCGAAIMRPATGDFWVVWGIPSENEYEHFVL